MEVQVIEKTLVVNQDPMHRHHNLVQDKDNTSFHFVLDNVTDEIVRTQNDLDNVQNSHILEQILPTPLTNKSIGSTHSSPSVPETHVVVGNSSEFCPILQKDLNLVRHILV